ncbi:wntless-like protein [Labeo rohita]|uniref:Wntless-like protein n=1 Tax=Labeo rohita TaxID=84645 RepID=A0A498NUY1_LABRO|nr:wntless-like protein [Labeo rohita]
MFLKWLLLKKSLKDSESYSVEGGSGDRQDTHFLQVLACAAMTVIFFIISQVNEGHWHWGGYTVQVNSAFFTGIYGMWNLYVFALMFLYAPSHKRYGDEQSSGETLGQ